MLLEVLATTWPARAAIGGTASDAMRAVATTASTSPSLGEDSLPPTTPVPSWTDQLSAYGAAVSAVAACLTLGIALLAVLYTARQVREARNQLEEARMTRREQAQPYVVMYAEPSDVDPLVIELVIRNYGTTAAYRVTPQLQPTLRRSNFLEGAKKDVVDVRLPHVLPILAPGQEYRTLWDHGRHRGGLSLPQEHRGVVTYRDSQGASHESPVDLSWYQVGDSTLLVRYGPHHSAKALREIHSTLKRWNSPTRALKVITTDGDARAAKLRALSEDQQPKAGSSRASGDAAHGGQPDGQQSSQTQRARMRQIRRIARLRPTPTSR